MPVFTRRNVELTLVPSEPTMAMQATMISASMTAYSTAVGPSSLARNRWTRDSRRMNRALHLGKGSTWGRGSTAEAAVDLAERRADARAERRDDGDAGDDDQGEHDGVLDRR